MKITLITPANPNTRVGNRISAKRWSKLLRSEKHNITISTKYDNSPTELMIALHAWRSADSIFQYRKKYPNGPLIIVIGGTDANTFLKTNPNKTLKSLNMANAIVGLHEFIGDLLPTQLQKKIYFIPQSALPLTKPRMPSKKHFDVTIVAHLRYEKDPFRAVLAGRLMPADSKLRIIHYGKALSKEWATAALKHMNSNPRYLWKGEVPQWQIRKEYRKTQLIVISSLQEGGANVVSEAIAARVPIIASKIHGNMGLLGKDYSGYFDPKDEYSLSNLLIRAETQPDYLESLNEQLSDRYHLFKPNYELSLWNSLIRKVTKSK